MRRENLETYSSLLNSDLNQIAHAEKSILALFGGGCHLALGANIHKTPAGKFHLKFYYHDTQSETHFEESYSTLTELLRDTVNRTFKIKESSERVWLTQPMQHQLEVIKKFANTKIQPISLPLTEVRPTWTHEQLVQAADKFPQTTSLVFTSRFGVRLFFLEFISCFPELYDQLAAKKIYCIGPATQKEFKNYCHLHISSPQVQTGAALYDILPDTENPLLVGTEDSEVKKLFDKSGRNYTFLSLYKSLKHTSPLNNFTSAKNGDKVIITSPKAAEYFSQIYHPDGPKLSIYAFGPTTAKKLEALKIPYTVNPVSGSWDAMINEVVK
jgi:uroporphyrinogen-III synthase